jgi:hypothetical protein
MLVHVVEPIDHCIIINVHDINALKGSGVADRTHREVVEEEQREDGLGPLYQW